MAAVIGCIAGAEIHRQWQEGRLAGERLGPRDTPFGPSGEVFLVTNQAHPFYGVARYGEGMRKTAPCRINDRANLYAMKDLGVRRVLGWGAGGAIRHNIAVGDLVILDDVIDQTYRRAQTFFEDSPLGYLREFPVFCPSLRKAAADVADALHLPHHDTATAAVREGPRLETPAEIRMLAAVDAAVVTHLFAPEVFLARELQLCYAAVCYVVNYAETGSRHQPFAPGGLFGGLVQHGNGERASAAPQAMGPFVAGLAAAVAAAGDATCECQRTLAQHAKDLDLPADWHDWFERPGAGP